MSPGQFWAAVVLTLIVIALCWRSENIDTSVGGLLAIVFLLAVVYLLAGDPA